MVSLASDWLRHFRLLLWNRWTEFKESWQEARSQCPLQSLCFSGLPKIQDGRPGLWLAGTCSTSLKPLNGIQRNLTGSKIPTSSTKFVFFEPIGKSKMATLASCWLIHFHLLWNRWTEYSRKLDRKQDLNVLDQVCVFRSNMKSKVTTLASDWLRHFRPLWNRWTECKEIWQDARFQRPLPRLCFWTNRKSKVDALDVSDYLRHFRLLWNRWTKFNKSWPEEIP